jgi:hypothetical protein
LRNQQPDVADRSLVLGGPDWGKLWQLDDNLAVRLPWPADRAPATCSGPAADALAAS